MIPAIAPRDWLPIAAMFAVLCATCILYWPVTGYSFVWDDGACLHDSAWLRNGDAWKGFLFRHFCDWTNYFRPVAVAAFVIEVRAFDVEPGPMHAVSLTLHLFNTVLVGLLAARWSRRSSAASSLLPSAAMLFFGVHPALVEPVTWISSQTELLLTCFFLLGLLANASIPAALPRAVTVALCFLLAACCKESAVAFPAVLMLMDWMMLGTGRGEFKSMLTALWRRQWPTYIAVMTAGAGYLALRTWALGSVVDPLLSVSAIPPLFTRLQEGAFAYLAYWRLLLWPMLDLGPTHVVDASKYAAVSATSVATDIASLLTVAIALVGAWRRNVVGCLIFAVTLVLLPALHLLPVVFDASLYHARYAMLALALACAITPRAVVPSGRRSSTYARLLLASACIWLALAVINLRVTLPLWRNETALWQWDLRTNPGSIAAKEHLLAIAVQRGDVRGARKVLELLGSDIGSCATCRIQAAYLAMTEGDLTHAADELAALKSDESLATNARLLHAYIEANGLLLELRHDLAGAEEAYRDAIRIDPLEPITQMTLASVLAREGKTGEARQVGEVAIDLFAPEARASRRKELERVLSGSAAATRAQNPAPVNE